MRWFPVFLSAKCPLTHGQHLFTTHETCIPMFLFKMAAYMRVCLSCFYAKKKQRPVSMRICLFISTQQLVTSVHRCVRTDGQTDTVLVGRSLSTGREKGMRCRTHVKKGDQIELLFSAQPSPFLGLIENTTFVHLSKKFEYLNADFL